MIIRNIILKSAHTKKTLALYHRLCQHCPQSSQHCLAKGVDQNQNCEHLEFSLCHPKQNSFSAPCSSDLSASCVAGAWVPSEHRCFQGLSTYSVPTVLSFSIGRTPRTAPTTERMNPAPETIRKPPSETTTPSHCCLVLPSSWLRKYWQVLSHSIEVHLV